MIGSPQQLAQPCTEWAATAANGRLTFTTVGPRRGSITISSEATGELCTSTGTKCRVCRHGTRCAHRPFVEESQADETKRGDLEGATRGERWWSKSGADHQHEDGEAPQGTRRLWAESPPPSASPRRYRFTLYWARRRLNTGAPTLTSEARAHTEWRLTRSERTRTATAAKRLVSRASVTFVHEDRCDCACAVTTRSKQRSAKLQPAAVMSRGKSEIGVNPGKVLTSEMYHRPTSGPLERIKKSIRARPRPSKAPKSSSAAARSGSLTASGRSGAVVVRETPSAYFAS